MLDKKSFEAMRREYELADQRREGLIQKSREVVKLSKQLIYAVQRHDIKEAERFAKELREKKQALGKENEAVGLDYTGALKIALQEYVEALVFFEFVRRNDVPSAKALGVSIENYLLGLGDLTGELVRLAINYAIKGETEKVIPIKEFVSELYYEMMQFDFRNSELRKKFDGMKYDLKKLEELVLGLKLK